MRRRSATRKRLRPGLKNARMVPRDQKLAIMQGHSFRSGANIVSPVVTRSHLQFQHHRHPNRNSTLTQYTPRRITQPPGLIRSTPILIRRRNSELRFRHPRPWSKTMLCSSCQEIFKKPEFIAHRVIETPGKYLHSTCTNQVRLMFVT